MFVYRFPLQQSILVIGCYLSLAFSLYPTSYQYVKNGKASYLDADSPPFNNVEFCPSLGSNYVIGST